MGRLHTGFAVRLVVEYDDGECGTWATVFDKLTALYPTHACRPFNAVIDDIGYARDAVPQLFDVSRFLTDRTGFALQPVAGLVSAREFLGALSRRVFCSTQYIRHHSEPLYTPEPDIVHELWATRRCWRFRNSPIFRRR